MNKLLLSTKNIKKSFHTKQVLNGIDMQIKKGEVHGLVGKNGAGKSTFVNIITGLVDTYEGDVIFKGENINANNVSVRQQKGLFIVPQHTAIVNEFTVAENIFIGLWPKTKNKMVDWKSINKEAANIFKSYGFNVNPKTKASQLSLVDRRKLNILRALFSEADLIILDEPTTSLTKEERTNLFDFINEIKDKGTSFIFISHYLDEVLDLCDSITVLKDGYSTSLDFETEKNEDKLSEKMVGKNIELYNRTRIEVYDEIMFSCQEIQVPYVNKVSFDIHKGEIIGFVGFIESGAREVMRAIGGLEKDFTGKLVLNGEEIKVDSVAQAIMSNLYYIPYDRHDEGLVQEMSILHNISLSIIKGKLQKALGIIDKKEELKVSKHYYDVLDVKANNTSEKVRTLSGGNQQKILIAKGLATEPKLLMLDEPTIGVDIESREEILNMVNNLANEGISIIYHTSDYSEMLRICDKLYFFNDGRLTKQIKNENLCVDQVTDIRDSLERRCE